MLASFVHIVAEVNARMAAVYRILTSAAASDDGAATLLDELTQQRRRGQGQITRALARRRMLRDPLRERDAADIVHALASPEVYGLLVVDRDWPPQRYETWLTETLVKQLLSQCFGACCYAVALTVSVVLLAQSGV